MSIIKKLKNNSGASKFIITRNVSDQDYYNIPPYLWDQVLSEQDIIDDITSGDIIVNNGLTDLPASEGLDWLARFETGKIDVVDNLIESDRIKVDVTGTLSDGKIKVSDNDSATGFLEEKIVAADNKITVQTINDGADEDIEIGIVPSNIGTSELTNDANFINSGQAPVQPSDISDFETFLQLNSRDIVNRNRANHTGTQLASTISDFTSAVQASETDTSLSFNNTTKIISYTNEAGSISNVDLNQFLDNTNLAQIISGTLNQATGIVTFTRDDNSTFTVDFSSLNDQAAINTAISTHEQSINNHSDVDITTVAPVIGSKLTWNGSEFVPETGSTHKDYAIRTSGEINQTNTYEEYLNLTTTVPTAGNYKISWSYTWSVNTTGNDFIARIEVDNSNEIMKHQQEVKDSAGSGIPLPTTGGGNINSSTNQRYQCSGFFIVNLTAGTHVIDLDYKGEVNKIEPAIYQATLTIEGWE